MKLRASRIERMLAKIEATLVPPPRKCLSVITSKADDLESAFTTLAQREARAVIIGGDTFFTSRRSQISLSAARRSLPTMWVTRIEVEAGGLMSYGANIPNVYRQAGVYAGQILKGAKPANLPVQLPIKFDLVINLQTAKALGLDVPPTFRFTAGRFEDSCS